MDKVFNFSAGPAMLPQAVMARAQAEFINWHGLGVSVMEMSHRSKEYIALAAKAEQDLRTLLKVPDNYSVLFCQGGGRGQFAAVPLNILPEGAKADYLVTGQWSQYAVNEGQKYAELNVTDARSEKDGVYSVTDPSSWSLSADAGYVHYCPNETIEGIELFDVPQTGEVPLVADMSSTILSRPLDISKFGIVYAGAQKNIGPSGLTLVIVRNDLLGRARQACPSVLNYEVLAKADSMYNTPPTYAWYLAGLVFEWLLEQGGVEAIDARNQEKADFLYGYLDSSDFYGNKVDPRYRSRMNVPFQLRNPELDSAFLKESAEAGLMALKGHRIVGGMRASIYNAMPLEGVKALVGFMEKFAVKHG